MRKKDAILKVNDVRRRWKTTSFRQPELRGKRKTQELSLWRATEKKTKINTLRVNKK